MFLRKSVSCQLQCGIRLRAAARVQPAQQDNCFTSFVKACAQSLMPSDMARTDDAGAHPRVRAGTVAPATAFGDVLFAAVPYGALPALGQEYGDALNDKIVLEACNAVRCRDGAIVDEVERNGIGFTLQKSLSGTRLVRAFNTVSYMILAREANRPDPKMRFRLPATMLRRCGWRPSWCAMPTSSRGRSAAWRMPAASSVAGPARASL